MSNSKKSINILLSLLMMFVLSSCVPNYIDVKSSEKNKALTGLGVSISKAVTETVMSCSFVATANMTSEEGFSYRVKFSGQIDPTSFTTSDIVNVGDGGTSALSWSLLNCGDDTNFKLSAVDVSGSGTIIPQISAGAVLDVNNRPSTVSTSVNNSVVFSTGWYQEAYIKANNSGADDAFGKNVSISGDWLAVGAYTEDSNQNTITNGATANADNSLLFSGAVYVYKRNGNNWEQEAFIKASNSAYGDFFGFSVSLSEDSLAVGAYSEDSNQATITNGATASSDNTSVGSGAVYIYKRTGVNWAQEAYIKASNNDSGDDFGYVSSLSKNTLAVGVYKEDSAQNIITNGDTASADDFKLNSGAVYIYRRTGVSWVQEAYIKATNSSVEDQFGRSVSVSGDSLAVGALREDSDQLTITNGATASVDNSSASSGAVYIYKRTGVNWEQEAYIKASNNGASDLFGYSVSLSGDSLAVGATEEDSNQITITDGASASADNSNSNSGAVYIYKRTGVNWAQEAYIKASNNGISDLFGYSVSLSGDSLAVGATEEDSNQISITDGASASADNSNSNSGAVYIYKRTGVNWAQEAYIKASNNGVDDNFGNDVSLNGNTLAVGAIGEDSNQSTITNGLTASADNSSFSSGAVYIYRNIDRLFSPSNLSVNASSVNSLTLSWANSGPRASGYRIAYGPGTTPPIDCNAGTVVNVGNVQSHVFSSLSHTTRYSFRICSYDSSGNLSEGHTTTFATDSMTPEAASFIITDRSDLSFGLSWVNNGGGTTGFKIAYLLGTTPPNDCNSGTTVDVGNVSTYIVSGLSELSNYSFKLCSYNSANDLSYGVNIMGATLQSPAIGWNQEAYIKAINGNSSNHFGHSVSVSGETLVVGASTEDSNQTTITNGPTASTNISVFSSGAAYVYKRTGVEWVQEAYIKASNPGADDNFGYSVSLSGNSLAVAAHREDSNQTFITNGAGTPALNNSSSASGAVYVYKRTGVNWAQEAYIKASNNGVDDYFGYAVSLNGENLAVGAYHEDSNQTTITNGSGTPALNNSSASSGAVYVYRRTGVNWAQEAYIKAINSGASNYFGFSVSLYGDSLAVGASGEDSNQSTITNGATASADNSSFSSGAVYVYKRTGVNWAQEAYIKASNSGANDNFGSAVSLSGNSLAVAAYSEASNQTTITSGTIASADNSSSSSGAVYVFKRTGFNWAQEAYIKASNNGVGDLFGHSVSLSGDSLAVGADDEDSSQVTITNGVSSSADNNNSSSGAVYIYKRTGVNWAQEAYIKASNSSADDSFGYSVSINGDTLAVGAYWEDSNQTTITNGQVFLASSDDSLFNSGAVYVYRNNARLFDVHEAWTTATSSSITLTWQRSGGSAVGYYYAYQLGTTAPATCLLGTSVDAGNVITSTASGLAPSTTYSFRLCANQDATTFSEGITFSRTTSP